VAEARHSDGQALIGALAAAFGVTGALKQLLGSGIEAHGLHWPGQLLATASAVAACKLAQATAGQMASAMSLAGCLAPVAPFEAFTKGASAKDLYGGWGGMLGVLAARLSSAGFAGPASQIEGTRGLARAWLHAPPSPQDLRSALAVARSDEPLQCRFKPFASCVSAHPALSALEIVCSQIGDARGQLNLDDLDVDDIARVEVRTYTYAVELSSESTGQTPVSARINIPYLCAALLLDGAVGGEQAEEPRRSDPRLHELAAKVSVVELSDTDAELSARSRPASVAVTMRDGERFEATVSGPKWDQHAPPSDAELEHKFHRLVGNLIPPARREVLVRTLWQLETVTDIGDVVAYLV
jgi:2-methylcitrate dehydratase PrpD